MKNYNLSRISRRCVDLYTKARSNGKTSVTIRTKVQDVNALAIAIKARAPKMVVHYECLTDKLVLSASY